MRVQKLNRHRFLGVRCIHGHSYKDTGGSIRYKACHTCCVCNAISVDHRKVEQKEYRNNPKNKKKMKKYQQDYRKAKRRKNEKKYMAKYFQTVTKPKRKRDRHNKKLLKDRGCS